MRYVVIARDGTDGHAKDRRLRTRPAHLDGIERFVERGEILVGGAILDDEGNMVGSIVLADFTTRSELEAWLKADPYVTEGVWQEVEVRGFRPAVGAWLPES